MKMSCKLAAAETDEVDQKGREGQNGIRAETDRSDTDRNNADRNNVD